MPARWIEHVQDSPACKTPLLGLLLAACLGAIAAAAGCASHPIAIAPMAMASPPPQDELKSQLGKDPIKAMDVIQINLGGGNTATVTQNYQVATDGTIQLAGCGQVVVAGKTVEQAQQAILDALRMAHQVDQFLEVSLREYYLVQVSRDGSRKLTRVPLGKEVHVKEAVAAIPDVNHKVIWVVRPSLGHKLSDQVLPVDWEMVALGRNDSTNYPLQAGDWLFIGDEPTEGSARVFGAMTGMFKNK